jgi:DNA polymerase
VFGEGDPRAEVMFIGEGPGADEDRTGRPFVGQAGKLLDEMIFALGFERPQVYIGNVVKCRPPGNRDPGEDEMAACAQFLDRQIELIGPRVIVALGRVAARRLTGTDKPMGALRGRWTPYRGIPLIPIFHPAYLLRNELAKRTAWDDLKSVQQRLSGVDSDSRA